MHVRNPAGEIRTVDRVRQQARERESFVGAPRVRTHRLIYRRLLRWSREQKSLARRGVTRSTSWCNHPPRFTAPSGPLLFLFLRSFAMPTLSRKNHKWVQWRRIGRRVIRPAFAARACSAFSSKNGTHIPLRGPFRHLN